MKLGDEITARPLFGGATGESVGKPQKGVVVYIHPQKRFYTLEFKSQVTSERFRESYYFADRLTAEERKAICDLSRS